MERNKENMKQATSRNVIGLLGVSQKGKKFQAQISGKAFGKKYLGLYPTAEAAHAAYLAAKRLLHAGCTI